jgi:polyhydroxyalkanoate synthesis regulator phasin
MPQEMVRRRLSLLPIEQKYNDLRRVQRATLQIARQLSCRGVPSMVNDDAPKTESSAEGAQTDPAPNRSLTGQIRNEALVQSANLFLVARRILTTSLGAIALSIEETNEFIERLVERGEMAEQDISAMIEEMLGQVATRGKSLVKSPLQLTDDAANVKSGSNDGESPTLPIVPDDSRTIERSKTLLGDRVESILGRLNVPTRTDIENLTSKIEVLSGKVLLLRSKSQRSSQYDLPAPTDEVETLEEMG